MQWQNLIMKIKLKNEVRIKNSIIKKLFWYIIVNLALLLTLYLALRNILIDNAVYFLGLSSIISFLFLLLSKTIVKHIYEIKIISEDNILNDKDRMLYELVRIISEKYCLDKVPEVGIYQSEEVNAFATGRSRNNSLIAFSDSLLEKLDVEALAGVIGHEISHIVNGDMFTMCILTGVIYTILILISIPILPLLIFKIADDTIGRAIYNIGTLALLIASFFVTFVSNFFSRNREYKADKGSAELLGKEVMIKTLREIQSIYIESDNTKLVNSFKMHNECKYFDIFSTHPSIKNRIENLEN